MAKTRYIVYVDDDEDDRELMADVFAAISNFIFITFPDGASFFEYLEDLPETALPSLVILDINMPTLKGTDILVQLKATDAYKDIPVVMFSTGATPQDQQICKQLNIDIVSKPTKFEDVVEMANTLKSYCAR
jgi:CheY-like chemotaxis protein